MPKYAEFAAAFSGVQLTLTNTTQTAEASDKQSSSMAQQFADKAKGICKF